MEKFINSSDLFLRKINDYFDLCSNKVKNIFLNAFFRYIFMITVLLLSIVWKVIYYNGLLDAFAIFIFLFYIFLLMIVIIKTYVLHPNVEIKNDLNKVEQNFLPQEDLVQKQLEKENLGVDDNLLPDFYIFNKPITKKVKKEISGFYEVNAIKYFHVINFTKEFFVDFVLTSREISISDRIELREDKSNADIAIFLDELGQLCGMSRIRLGILFKKRVVSTGVYKKVDKLALTSSLCQLNKH